MRRRVQKILRQKNMSLRKRSGSWAGHIVCQDARPPAHVKFPFDVVTIICLVCRKEEDLKQLKNKLKLQASEASKRKNQLGSNAADREKYQKDIEIANKQLQELGSLPEAFEK
jgi:hypothetical protein